jgi:hypothetical protein
MTTLGTIIKANIGIEPIGSIHLADCDFECTFTTCGGRSLKIEKSKMIKLDADNYTAKVDTSNLSYGRLFVYLKVFIPDIDVETGVRTEIERIDTGIILYP